jgi:NAD(P) transhydrogenase subunit alpha
VTLALLVQEAESAHSLPFLLVGAWVLLLAIFAGAELISKVPPTLHTPLMSGSNAISGITLVGAVLASSFASEDWGLVMVFFAVAFATVNVVGGYAVTDRMLRMFKKKDGG